MAWKKKGGRKSAIALSRPAGKPFSYHMYAMALSVGRWFISAKTMPCARRGIEVLARRGDRDEHARRGVRRRGGHWEGGLGLHGDLPQ